MFLYRVILRGRPDCLRRQLFLALTERRQNRIDFAPLSLGRDLSPSVAGGKNFSSLFAEPYRNVIRMHMLIFFFFFAHFAGLENFAVYAVIYAVYFFPWRLIRKPAIESAPISMSTGT